MLTLPDKVLVMDSIDPNHVDVIVINTIQAQWNQMKSVRLWPLTDIIFVDGLCLSEVAEYLCKNPSNDSNEEFFAGVKKATYRGLIRKKIPIDKVHKIDCLL